MERSHHKAISRRVEHGAWVKDIPGAGDLRLKVRARYNSDYRRREAELVEAEPAENKPDGVLTDEARDRIDRILLLETVLVGWDGYSEGGQPIPFSRDEAAKDLLPADENAFRGFVSWAAMHVAEKGALDEASDAKN